MECIGLCNSVVHKYCGSRILLQLKIIYHPQRTFVYMGYTLSTFTILEINTENYFKIFIYGL